MFNLFKRKKIIYYQDTGKEMTSIGGYVTSDGEIYSPQVDMEIFQSRSMADINFKVEFKSFKEVWEEIKEKRLIHFGKLEDIFRG
jgi:hypothetical protein